MEGVVSGMKPSRRGVRLLRTGRLAAPAPAGGLWETRAAAYRMYDAPGIPRCTVAVTAYNRLHKTRRCVECILSHTKDIDHELLLIDNGSNDGTLEYFRAVEHKNKKIVRITKNIGTGYAWRAARESFGGKYLVIVANDVYVTKNWLSNLLRCYEADPKTGFVGPVSSNVSNLQQVDLPFENFEDMQRKAALYNQSDPLKWEERLRIISLIGVYSRPVLDTVGIADAAYPHDFTEDDFAMRLRRAGYKLMLCRDTWVCHDHDYANFEDKDREQFLAGLAHGRAVFKEKYHGLDAWDDVLNMEHALLAHIEEHDFRPGPGGRLRTLVIDGRCGTPVLEVRNRLRRRGFADIESHAYTTHAKYYADLQTVAEAVQCGLLSDIEAYCEPASYDLVALCEPLNAYAGPGQAMQSLSRLLRPGGLLLCKRREADGAETVLRSVN